MAAWLARIHEVGWTCYLSEPRRKLVVLREMVARGQARRGRTVYEQLFDFLFPGPAPDQPLHANKRATRKRGQPRLPDGPFSLIMKYYWSGDPWHRPRLATGWTIDNV